MNLFSHNGSHCVTSGDLYIGWTEDIATAEKYLRVLRSAVNDLGYPENEVAEIADLVITMYAPHANSGDCTDPIFQACQRILGEYLSAKRVGPPLISQWGEAERLHQQGVALRRAQLLEVISEDLVGFYPYGSGKVEEVFEC